MTLVVTTQSADVDSFRRKLLRTDRPFGGDAHFDIRALAAGSAL